MDIRQERRCSAKHYRPSKMQRGNRGDLLVSAFASMLSSDGKNAKALIEDDGLRARREAFDLLNPSKSTPSKKLSYQRGMRSNLLWKAFMAPSNAQAAAKTDGAGDLEVRDLRMRAASSPGYLFPRKSIPHQRGARGALLSTVLHGLIGTNSGEEHRSHNMPTANNLRDQSKFFNDAEVQLQPLDQQEPNDADWLHLVIAVDTSSIMHLFEQGSDSPVLSVP
eukprot:766504-Hanusia_phi.AAC.2